MMQENNAEIVLYLSMYLNPQAIHCSVYSYVNTWVCCSDLLLTLGILCSFSRRLDANHINYVPPNSFNGLLSLRHLWLDDNALTEIPMRALESLSALQAMTLALNKIHHIPDHAFRNLSSLVVLWVYFNIFEFQIRYNYWNIILWSICKNNI